MARRKSDTPQKAAMREMMQGYSDLIAQGEADLIISMEPMEALRYLPYLQEEGWVITSANPFKNIPDYPEAVSYTHLKLIVQCKSPVVV